MESSNTALWNSACKTDPAYTKQFSRAGGFSGTAISPMYLVRRATETFGPIGTGWGFKELESKIAEGVWFSRVELWYLHAEKRGAIEQWGATTFINKRKDGSTFVDEEAAKKSVTDAVTKCLSYLGFAADVHMGLYDDNKYMSELMREKREPKSATAKEELEGSREAQKSVAERKLADMGAQPAPQLVPGSVEPPQRLDRARQCRIPSRSPISRRCWTPSTRSRLSLRN
jgi:hypothetical protein